MAFHSKACFVSGRKQEMICTDQSLLSLALNCSFAELLTDVSPAVWLKMVISPAHNVVQ